MHAERLGSERVPVFEPGVGHQPALQEVALALKISTPISNPTPVNCPRSVAGGEHYQPAARVILAVAQLNRN